MRAHIGRIAVRPPDRCEALGLYVLADTDRGPAVQAFTAFVPDVFIGSYNFQRIDDYLIWPDGLDLFDRQPTTTLSDVAVATGGLVGERNGLVDARPTSIGTEFAESCSDANPAPFLGYIPTLYVAEPQTSRLHAFTPSLGAVNGGGLSVAAPMDGSINRVPILLAADADGDAGYYSSIQCLPPSGPNDCRRLFLGDAVLHYVIENIETSNVILQQPPKHVDYLPALGGVVNVSMRDDYYAQFVQEDSASGSMERKAKTDWTVGENVGLAIGPPSLPGTEFNSVFDLSMDLEHEFIKDSFASSTVSTKLTQTTGAIGDDVVWSKIQTTDFWRFLASGGKPLNAPNARTGFADDAYMEIAVPAEPTSLVGPGTLNDQYQPTHQVGNILTYPSFAGDVQDIGELFGLLGGYIPSSPEGARQCKPLSDDDPAGCLIRLGNGALERVSEVLFGEDLVAGEFQRVTNPIDVAEILQVGGISYRSELQFDESVRNGQSVTNSDKISASLDIKVPLSIPVNGIPLQVGELEGGLRAATSFEQAELSENTVGSRTTISLNLPSSIPVERSYRIRPSFGYSPGGALKVSYQVSTKGAAEIFWDEHYSGPDVALNLPHRIVRIQRPDGSAVFELGTDQSRNRIKGFFVRDGDGIDPSRPAARTGPILTAAPRAGEPVQLEVMVYNLSLATPVENLTVRFKAQAYEKGRRVGSSIRIGETQIGYLPYRGQRPNDANAHVKSAYVLWDTTAFGPAGGDSLQTWYVSVILDPADRIPNETHELNDRFGDPLRNGAGVALSPALEKGQNNRGWSLVRVAAATGASAAAGSLRADRPASLARSASVAMAFYPPASGYEALAGRGRPDPDALDHIEGRGLRPLSLMLGLHSDRLVREHGLLQVFDGDPEEGGRLILSRTVRGLDGRFGTFEQFEWSPPSAGHHVLHARYLGAGVEGRPTIRIPVYVGGSGASASR